MASPGRAPNSPVLAELAAQIRQARTTRTPLRIVGGDTKCAWWQTAATTRLALDAYHGIIAYEPSELVITARAGTLLEDIEAVLAARGQMLGFEPPRTGRAATLGGAVAAALSGPARPYRGAVRDFVLGVNLLTHDGEALRFGGQVMKNVAGYDVSRLLCGSWGRLGPITEVSLRVTPAPAQTLTARWQCDETEAWRRMREIARAPLPISACLFAGQRLSVRLSGAAPAVQDAIRVFQPDEIDETVADWNAWRDFTHPFFTTGEPVWRAVVPAGTPPLAVGGTCVWDWGGALRWYKDVTDRAQLARAVGAAGGHVRCWPSPGLEPAHPAARSLAARVRAGFDPADMFNPGIQDPDARVGVPAN